MTETWQSYKCEIATWHTEIISWEQPLRGFHSSSESLLFFSILKTAFYFPQRMEFQNSPFLFSFCGLGFWNRQKKVLPVIFSPPDCCPVSGYSVADKRVRLSSGLLCACLCSVWISCGISPFLLLCWTKSVFSADMQSVKAEDVESLIDLSMSAKILYFRCGISLLNCIIGFINKNEIELTIMVLPFPLYICVCICSMRVFALLACCQIIFHSLLF